MKKKYKKKLLVALTILMVCLASYEIADTYALFQKNTVGSLSTPIAEWEIILNGTTMGVNVNEFSSSSFIWSTSSNVSAGKVAPGLNGYYDILINPGTSQTAMRYDITFDFSELTNEKFIVTSISEIVDDELIRTDENIYTGVIDLADISDEKSHRIRINIEWQNDENNNDIDSEMGLTPYNSVNIPVTVDVIQYTGETITSYIVG